MKHFFKKGLSLFLAVLMVVSMLPMDAMAVAFLSGEDEPDRVEEPVLDVGDPIVDTQAGQISRDDREAVETPDTGEGDEPAKPSWTNLPLELEIDQSGNYTIKISANGVTGSGGSGNNAFAIMLDKAAAGGVAPGSLPVGSGHANVSALTGVVAATKLPNALFEVGGDVTFTFAGDGSYNGEVLQGSLGSFQDFLAEAQKIDPSLSGEIPLRVILVTQAGSPSSPAGVSQATFTWKAGKDAVLAAEGLSGGSGNVPGDGYVQLIQKNTTPQTFTVFPDKIVQDATVTIKNVVYTGLSQDNITISWPDSDGATWPHNMDVDGYGDLQIELDKYNAWSHPSGLIEGTITITYVVDGVAGDKLLEIPVHTKPSGNITGTSITIRVKQGETVTGGSTTLTFGGYATVGEGPAGVISAESYQQLCTTLDSTGNPLLSNTPAHNGYVSDAGVSGLTWKFVKTLPDLTGRWDEDDLNYWNDEALAEATCTIGASPVTFGANDLIEVTAASSAALGTQYVGLLSLPCVTNNSDDEGAIFPGYGMIASIPVFVEVIEGEAANNDFTLKYDANGTGVSGVPGDQTYSGPEATHSFALTFSPAPTRSGYVFKGWSDNSGSNNTADYTDGGTTSVSVNANSTKTVYAVWAPTYTVTYQNSSTTGHPSVTAPTDASSPYEGGSTVSILGVAGLSVGAERDGTESPTPKVYKFLGWDMGGTKYYTGDSFTINANATLTAAWEEVTYTVKYNGNGVTITNASSFTDETGLSNGAQTTKASGTPTATGKTFTGWATKADGTGTTVAVGSQYTVAKADANAAHEIILYAQWGDQTRTVSYDLNGKTFAPGVLTAPADETVTYGGDVDPLSTAISTSTNYVDTSGKGWTFVGWGPADTSTAADAITKVTNVTTNTTVYAIWAPTMHTVTYAVGAAGASGAVAAPTTYSVQHGTTHTVKATTDLTAATGVTDWKPNGWDETNSTITVNGDVTITGQWQVLVSFDENETSKTPNVAGVSGMPSAQWVDHGGKATAPTADPTASNWTFSSWKDAASGGNTVDFSTKTFTAPATIYATWGDKDTTAVFYLNGGDKWQDNATDASITVTGTPGGNASPGAGKTPPVRADYTFDGWATTNTGTTGVTPKFPAAGATAPNEYYAIWTRDQSNIKFVFGNGATDQTETGDTKASLTAAKFPANPTRANYRFNGWKGDDGAVYSSTALPQFPAAKNATLTITAQWVAQSTVVFDLNGGTLAAGKTIPGSQTGDVNTAIGTLPTAVAAGDVTKTGYTFAGWALNKNNGTAADAVTVANIKYPTTVNTTDTYYAIWTINTYTVTYDKGDHGGSDVPSPQTGNYNTTVTLTGTMNNSTESNIHWIFKGWSTTKNDTSTKVTKFDNIAADHKVYALWEKDTHNLTYNANAGGATVTNLPTTVTGVECGTATAVDVTTVPVWNASHRFLGWDTDSTATTPTYPKGVAANITLTSNTTLYAIWESVVTVTWKTGGGTWSTALGGGSADKTQTDKSGSPMTTYTGGTDVTRAGYRFKEWSNNPGTTMPNADTTYTAQWDRLYNVVFDLNAPSGATDITVNPTSVAKVTDKIVGETATLTALSDTQGNYVFKGWDTSSTATTATYTPTGTYTVVASHASGTDGDNAKITLYGVWVKKTNVTYNTGAGAWATAPSGGTTTSWSAKGDPTVSTDTYTVPADPARSGYDFAGWLKTGDAAVDTSKTAGSSHTFPAADETYTAQWKVKQYKVKFVWNTTANSHTALQEVTGSPTSGDFGAAITTPADPSMIGYTFGGWYKDDACTEANKLSGTDTYPANDDMIVYAKWTANQYKVTYNVGKNTSGQIKSGEDVQMVTYDDTSFKVKVGDLTNTAATIVEAKTGENLTGWTFVKWTDAAGNTWAEGADLSKITAPMTLTAQWTVDVTFMPNEQEGTPSAGTKKTAPAEGVVADFPANPTDLTHYTFKEWNTKQDGTGSKVTSTTTFDKPTTVYGQWTPKQYTVSFVDNSGDANNPADEANKDYNSTITLPASSGDKVGYTFDGWYHDDGTWASSAGAVGANYTVTKTETLYGKWNPVPVKIVYQSTVGTAPTETATPDYDTTYNIKAYTDISGGTWGTADSKPMFTDGSGNRYRFNGWKIGATTAGSTVKLDTAHGVVAPTAPATDYTLTLVADWTQLFTVSYANGGHGTVDPNARNFVNKPAGKNTTLQPSVAIPVTATGESWNGANTYFTDDGGKHWEFTGWKDQDGNSVGANTEINVSKDLTLTAQWKQQYKVTLAGPVLTDTATALGMAAEAKFGGKPLTSGTSNNFAWVPAGSGMTIADLALASNGDQYIFAKWTQQVVNIADLGDFTTDANGTSKDDTFTPKADTTLVPNYWHKPTLAATKNWYHLNFAQDATINKAPLNGQINSRPTYVWTKNSASLDTPQIEIEIGGTWTALNVGTDVTATADASGNVTYVFQDTYLKNNLTVPAGDTSATYNIRVNSHTPDQTTTNGENTVLTSTLTVYVTPDPLKRVDIWATNGASISTTANVNAATGRDGVEYNIHDPLTIEKDNKLTYTWYYGPTPANQHDYSTAGAANNATNVNNATSNLPSDKALLSSVDATVTDGASAPVTKAALKGKYIYAVVAASGTGYGAVITNPIAVDYDAVVKVQQDGTAIATANKGNYSVYLVPQPSTGSNDATYAALALPTGSVEAKAQSGLADGLYQTDDSALTGGVTYDVYANKVEGDKTIYVKVPSLSISTQINADAANPPTVNFYSMNAVNTAFDNAKADGGVEVPETFGTTPGTKFTTAGAGSATIDVGSTKGVLSGTTVTAAANDTWTQDYVWNWDSTTTAPGTLDYDGTDKQTSGNATKNYTISNKTWIGGELEQNVYTIVGDIKGTGGKVDKATLSVKNGDNTYTFTGAMTNGQPGDKVTFKVPKSKVTGAINDDYLLTATGAADPRTTIRGYSVPSKTAADSIDPMKIETVTAGGTDKFTIFIDASTWQLKVEDDHMKDAVLGAGAVAAHATVSRTHSSPVTDSTKVEKGSASTAWAKTFANYNATNDQLTYNVTVSNPGNTDLKVSLAVKKTVGSTTTTIFDSATALTTDTNNVAFANLAASFDLAAKTDTTEASKTFTVTIPNDLDNDDDVTYSFEFTSVDKNDATVFGPSLTYNLGLTVAPIPVKSVGIDAKSDGTFAAKDLTFDATLAPLDSTAPTLTTANDLTYQWYVGAKPTVAADGTVTAGTPATGAGNNTATYTPVTADGGETLWLVVSGKNNASKYATASVKAPYQAAVTILENTTATTDYGDYKVYLVPSTVTSQPAGWAAAGAVEATHHSGDAQGVFTTDGAKLVAGTTYNVWTNVVKGTTNAVYQNSGALSAVTNGVATKTVTYYSVTISETTYDNQYAGLKGTDFFGTGAAGTTAAPQTGNTGITATAKAGATPVANGGWVIAGTEVDFAHAKWDKDYTLAWTGATKEGTDGPTSTGSAAKATINANKTVSAELTLTLYTVTGYAVGKGEALYISMTSTGDANANVFTTKTDTPDANAIVGINGGSKNSVNAGSNVVFQVPKGTYTVSAPVDPDGGTTRLGYRETHAAAALIETETFVKNVNADDNYDVVLSSAGIGLKVVDNDTPGDPHEVSDVWQSGDAKPAKDTTHTQTLEFGYSSPVDILLTVKNNSSTISDTDARLQTVYEITAKGEDPDASGVIWDSTTLKADGSVVIDEMADGATEPTVKLTIPKDLEAGTYNYKATFTFSNAVDGEAKGTLVYNLKIVVNPAEFATVTMKYDGAGAAIDSTKVLEAGKDLALDSATTTVNNVYASLTGGTDYHYAWYASADNSIVKADLDWNDTAGTVSVTGKTATAIGTVDMTLDAATIAGHQSEYIYLVIYATAGNGKVIEAAVSAPVRAGFEGVVQIEENGTLQTSEPKTAAGGAKYTVTLTDSKGTVLQTKWSDDADGYIAWDTSAADKAIHLDPTETYTATVSAYETAGATETLTKTIKGDDLAHNSHITKAEYFTVTAVATKAEHYVAAVGETFGAMPKAQLTIGGVDVDTKTVLKGQNVAAKFADVGSGLAWTQDYTLTWQDKKDNAADGTSLDDTALTDTAATAVSAGQTWSNITAKTYIGGRLDQNTYEITGSIVGTGSLTHVVMTDGNSNANTTVQGGTINKNNSNKITDVDNNGTAGNAGDTITLFVVKGQYALAATAATGTTVRGIEWAGGAFEPGASVSGKDVSADRTFTVYLDAASSVLRVRDTHATPDWADSDAKAPASNFKHADHKHEVYFSTMTGDDTQIVELENRGNTDLTLDEPTIWKVNDGATLASVKWADWTNANPVTALGTNGAYSETNVITITNQITDANKTLGAATPDASGVLGSFKKVTAATVTVSQNVDVADSGIYIIRYTTGENGPVVYYVLELVVKQLPITAVTTDTPAGAPGAGDKVQLEGATDGTTGGFDKVMVDDDGNTTTPAVAASTVAAPALVDGTDVKYQWVKAKTQLTPAQVKAALKVDASGVSATANTVSVLSGNGADSKQYTLQSADVDSFLYLVAYAPKDTVVNTTDFAVSAAIKTKETKGVRVKLDGTVRPISGHDQPFGADGLVEIYLLEDGKTWADPVAGTGGSVTLADGAWATTWSDDNNKLYQAAVDMNKTYHVYAPTYLGSTHYVDTGLTVGTGVTGIPEVPYWSVEHTADVTVKNTHDGFAAYLPDSTQTGKEDNAIQDALSVKVSATKGGTDYADTLTGANVPVLEGMKVQVTVDAAANSANTTGVKKSWSEATDLHTMTAFGWQDGTATAGAGVEKSGIPYPAGSGTPAAYWIQSGDITVNAKQNFTAQLDQSLFDVEFTVKDNTPVGTDLEGYTPGVRSAALTATETGVNLTLNHKSILPATGANGAKVLFEKVPVGAFEIKAVGQTRTSIDGYTWNATDLSHPVTPGKIVNVAGGATADTTNKHLGNTIQIQYSSNSIQWQDNFVKQTGEDGTAGDAHETKFYVSEGFEKVNTPTTGPWLALKDGYTTAGGAVLKYKVRVVNNGVMPLENFQIKQTTGTADLRATLDAVRVFDGTTGAQKEGADATANVTTGGFTLEINDWVEFDVEIPEGQAPSGTDYASHFEVSSSNPGNIAGGTYDPTYQVRPVLEFQPGGATVLYGGKAFETTPAATDISSGWQASYGTEPTFAYDILTEAELTAYLGGAARPANAYTKDGAQQKPDWLVLDGTTGKVTFDGNLRATDVDVQSTAGDFTEYLADPTKRVNNEVILYIKAVDAANNETYYTTYTVDVEPGSLQIVGDAFAPATAYIGQSVDKGAFTYTNVTNQIDEDVVAAGDIAGTGNNTANGNTAAKDGWVTTGTDNTPTASWSVDPTLYAKDQDQYTFTVTYKEDTPAEKWNYKPASVIKTITPQKPPMDLKFSDTLAAASYEPAGAEILVGLGSDYSDNVPNVKPEYAPGILNQAEAAFRTGEHIVYLDVEPRYNVTLTGVGDIYGVKVEKKLVGFAELDSTLSFTNDEFHEVDGKTKTFALELTPMPGTTSKYVGVHTAEYIVTGYSSAAEAAADPNREHPGVKATYTLSIEVTPKVIAQAHVTDLDDPQPGKTPDTTITITAKDPEGEEIKPVTPDKHDNTPMDPKVTWTDPQGNPVDPTKPFGDGKDYKVTVDLPADPNYTFKDQKQPEEIPNYTLNGKTDVNDDPALEDEKLTVWVTTENDPPVPDRNKKVTFEKTTDLPKFAHLEFEDVNADDEEDSMPHAVNVNRPTITVQRGDALGKYIISLGAYDNAVSPVEITQVNGLPDGAVWNLTPNTLDRLDDVTATPAGDKQSYTLDLSGVYTVDLDAKLYTLELTATGKDANYPDRDVTPATYKINIQVTPADPSKLMFKDLRTKGTDAETTNVITPAENVYAETYTRVITVKWDKANGGWYPLGTYKIDLGAFTNNVRDLALNSTGTITSDSVAKDLSAAIRDFNANQAKLDKDGVWSFALDLSDVDYATLNTDATEEKDLEYLELTATGKDLNGTTVKATYKLALKFEVPPKPVLKFDDVKQGGGTSDPATTGPEVNDTREITAVEGTKLGKYTIYLGAYDAAVKVNSITSTRSPNMVYDVTPDCATVTPVTLVERKGVGDAQAFELDLTEMVTKPGTYTLTLVAQGVDLSGKYTVNASYTLTITIRTKSTGGGGGGGGTSCPNQVTYLLGLYGTTKDSTMEMVSGKAVKSVPNVSALEGYKFLGWSLAGPTGNAEQDAKRTLVDPKSVTINGDTTFYAVYQVLYKVPQPPVHKHYVIGYPNGNFGPADNIDRASVATIIARAVLPNFVEGADYGNPGGYSDVDGHWAESAIAYCSKYGVFKGYDDGTFRPKQPISRQELALVMARLSGVKSGSAPFSDITTAGDWAKDGIYTAYANGWVNGYTDGTFKPLNPIRRDETVKIFNAYLGRGVDAEGLSALTEYVHTGVASNVTENGTTEYMTWPDVTKDQWAYYEIIEAANDHEFAVDATQPKGYAVPETWTKCWIDEKWRYHDDANDGGPSAVVSALTRKFGAAD